jgi:hypothetical protein
MAISKVDSTPFLAWFNRAENQGFYAYEPRTLVQMVKDFVFYHHELAYDMQLHPEEYKIEEYNTQAIRVNDLKAIYEGLACEDFVFEVLCTRDNDQCNQRRLAEKGQNHRHPVVIEMPERSDMDTYEEAIELREQCKTLGGY